MMETKQVIVMRKDLNMRKGKMVSQGSHASMKAILDLMKQTYQEKSWIMDEFSSRGGSYKEYTKTLMFNEGSELDDWLNGLFTKICVSVNSEEALELLYLKAKDAGLPCSLIEDVGLTEFKGVPTKTCIAIGPASVDKINAITGNLSLL